jgi:hypothetical protein
LFGLLCAWREVLILRQQRGEELSKAMKSMAIGDIMPREEDDDEDPSISIQANPSTFTTNDHNQ